MPNPPYLSAVKDTLYDSPSRTFYLYINTVKRPWGFPNEIYLNNSETLRVWIFELKDVDVNTEDYVYTHIRPGDGTYYLKVYDDKDRYMKAWNECRSG
jgi:hypothetical protein